MTGGWWKSSRRASGKQTQNGCRAFENQSGECRAVCRVCVCVCVFWLVHWSLLKWVWVRLSFDCEVRKATCISKYLSEYLVLQQTVRKQVVDSLVSEVTAIESKHSAHCPPLVLASFTMSESLDLFQVKFIQANSTGITSVQSASCLQKIEYEFYQGLRTETFLTK